MFERTTRKAAAAALIGACCLACNASAGPMTDRILHRLAPKYVFLFIGDGMASPQIHATEAYLAQLAEDDAVAGGDKSVLMNMSELPFVGSQLSYANDRFITGSAAAGTALSCGIKTNIGVIAQDPETGEACTTLAEAAKAKGMKVGIVSSVSIDHATPAVYYAHTDSRNNYEQIDYALLHSGFDYFGGGGFRVNKWNGAVDWSDYCGAADAGYACVEKAAEANGFAYADTRAEFDALQPTRWWRHNPRVIAVNPYLDGANAMPYALNVKGSPDDYQGSISLAEFTKKGIDLLDNPRGFFMMVEGGKIDWAAHANDARALIDDTIAFDDAVAVAMDFAKTHPRTLIVVTGDHECGGMSLGFAGTAYDSAYEILADQVLAYDDFDKLLADYQDDNPPADIDSLMWQLILENFGLDGNGSTGGTEDDLTDFQKDQLENAFDKLIAGSNANSDEENSILYGYYNPLSVTLTHILNNRAGLAFTSFSHTSVPVPVMSNDWRFNGYYENTEVANKIAEALRVNIGD